MRKRKNISIIMAGLLMTFVSFSPIHVSAAEAEVNENFKLDVKNDTDSEGKTYHHLEWTNLGKGYSYRAFRKGDKKEIYQSIPTEKSVKTLNIYPDVNVDAAGGDIVQTDLDGKPALKSALLKPWLLKENINDVKIDCVSLSSFNRNPSKYLKKENGVWNYNSVFYGMWNIWSNDIFPNDDAIEYLRTFIKDGGGFMTSHHTIGYTGLSKGVNKLYKELGVEIFSTQKRETAPSYSGTDASGNKYETVSFHKDGEAPVDNSPYWVFGNKVKIVKNGLLINYPFKVGKVGDVIEIPYTHGLGVFGKGDVWMNVDNPKGFGYKVEGGLEFKEITQSPVGNKEKGTNNFYVHTYNNTAIINSGHSSGQINKEETRIIANTLYYLSQITEKNSCDAHIGQDTTAPEMPKINDVKYNKDNNNFEIKWDAVKDLGTESYYYVEATEKGTNNKIKTEEQSATITSGIKGYSIVIDDKEDTAPKNEVNMYSNECTVDNKFDGDFYVHVAAIDNADNISKVDTYKYAFPILTLTKGKVESNTVKIKAEAKSEQSKITKIDLPNGEEVKSDSCEFTAKVNDTYKFSAYDDRGIKVTRSIRINDLQTDVNLDLNDEGDNAVLNWDVADKTQKYTYNVNSKKSDNIEYKSTSVEGTTYNAENDKDIAAPDKPDITNINIDKEKNTTTVKFNKSYDNSTSYDYYVEAIASETGIKSTSQVRTAKLMSGVKEYSIVVDQNPNTIPDGTITTTSNEYSFDKTFDDDFYVHVAAVDNAGNISEVSTKHYVYPKILDIRCEGEKIEKGKLLYVDVILDNINEDNKLFAIKKLTDIVNQNIQVKYDTSFLKYLGVKEVNEFMPLVGLSSNNGLINLNVSGEDDDFIKGKTNLVTLKFKVLNTGESKISIAEGIISDINGNANVLLPGQRGTVKLRVD